MASVFSKIIAGEIPSYKIAEDDKFYAFLDINPLVEGHTLVIPKKEIDYIFDLDDDLLSEMMLFSKQLSKALKVTFPCNRVGVVVLGLDVPHAHIHLIPINSADDINFGRPKLKFTPEEFENTVDKILANF